jgi:hypothetical protein
LSTTTPPPGIGKRSHARNNPAPSQASELGGSHHDGLEIGGDADTVNRAEFGLRWLLDQPIETGPSQNQTKRLLKKEA